MSARDRFEGSGGPGLWMMGALGVGALLVGALHPEPILRVTRKVSRQVTHRLDRAYKRIA